MRVEKGAKLIVRQGQSYAQDTPIDGFLSDVEAKVLYEKWDRSWAEPIELHGNQIMITCEMVAGAPLDQLTNTFGATLAAHFMEVAKRNTAM